MADKVRIRIRCPEVVREKWRKAAGQFDLTYGELAMYAAKFVLENEREFRRFINKESRRRDDRRKDER